MAQIFVSHSGIDTDFEGHGKRASQAVLQGAGPVEKNMIPVAE